MEIENICPEFQWHPRGIPGSRGSRRAEISQPSRENSRQLFLLELGWREGKETKISAWRCGEGMGLARGGFQGMGRKQQEMKSRNGIRTRQS